MTENPNPTQPRDTAPSSRPTFLLGSRSDVKDHVALISAAGLQRIHLRTGRTVVFNHGSGTSLRVTLSKGAVANDVLTVSNGDWASLVGDGMAVTNDQGQAITVYPVTIRPLTGKEQIKAAVNLASVVLVVVILAAIISLVAALGHSTDSWAAPVKLASISIGALSAILGGFNSWRHR